MMEANTKTNKKTKDTSKQAIITWRRKIGLEGVGGGGRRGRGRRYEEQERRWSRRKMKLGGEIGYRGGRDYEEEEGNGIVKRRRRK